MATSPEREQANRALLEEYLRRRQAEPQAGAAPIPTRQGLGEHADRAPLSFGQRQLWLHGQLAPDLPVYNELITFHHRGPLKLEVLRRSFVEIVRRHEIWRTGFELVDGEAAQVVHAPPADVPIAFNDLRRMHASLRRGEALRLTAEDARIPFDLARGPLWRARLVRMSDEEDRIYLVIHHLILDGVTIYRVLLPELAAIYGALESGRPSPLPEPVLQYGDYALWQQEQAPDLERQISYWEEQLAGPPPPLAWPSDRVRAPIQSFRGATEYLFIPSDLAEPLRELARSQGATLYMALMASLAALLHRYTGQTDIVLGAMTAGRTRPELESLMGYFINPLALRIDVGGQPSFNQVLGRVRTGLLEALSNADVPFTEVVRRLHAHRDHSRNPFFTIMMTLEPSGRDLPAGWDVSLPEVSAGASKVDMNLTLEERAEGIGAAILYNPDLFERATVLRAFEHWTVLMAGLIANPDRSLAAISLLTAKERHQLLQEWSFSSTRQPKVVGECTHRLFEERAAAAPRRIALVAQGRRLTYTELNQRANRLAHHLFRRGAGPRARVAVLLERSAETLIAPLAIFKAGAVYVPFDPASSPERLRASLAEANCSVVLTQRALSGLVPGMEGKALFLDGDRDAIRAESSAQPDGLVGPADLAYILYTSGSTGRPKGVEVEHRSLANLLLVMQQQPGIHERDVLVSVSSSAFDISLLEFFLPLTVGAQVVIAGDRDTQDGRRLLRLLEESRATVMQATPATWQLLIEAGWQGQPALKVLCGGEAMPAKLARELADRADSVWNLYGPTETTIWSTIYRVNGCEPGLPPIGRPIANTEVYVLDTEGEPVPAGVTGELYLGGAGLARGYFNRADETEARFVPHRFTSARARRLYRTGDLVAFQPDGLLEYRGRNDDQVKIRGYRIELGEIEEALLRHPAILQAAAAVWGSEAAGAAGRYLAAYYTTKDGIEVSVPELQSFLAGRLPAYMQPTRLISLARLPLRSNGKINRQALPEPLAEESVDAILQQPRNPIEHRLCDIWREVLQRPAVGIHQDFWDLGGHSLLAARLIYRIENAFGVTLPVSVLFEAPTIASLAKLLSNRMTPETVAVAQVPQAEVIALKSGGSQPALYCLCVHTPVLYRSFIRRVDADQPVLGVVYPDSLIKAFQPPYNMEELAACSARAILAYQPEGPYFIGGFCLSGLLAYETARYMSARGHRVALVTLFMTNNPVPEREYSYGGQFATLLAKFSLRPMALRWRKFRQLKSVKERTRYVLTLCKSTLYRFKMFYWAAAVGTQKKLMHGRLTTIHDILLSAARNYRPRPIQARVAVFGPPRAPGEDALRGWGEVVAEDRLLLRQVKTQGPVADEFMFVEPTVGPLAELIVQTLRDARQWDAQDWEVRQAMGIATQGSGQAREEAAGR